jgi:hypothetical protein
VLKADNLNTFTCRRSRNFGSFNLLDCCGLSKSLQIQISFFIFDYDVYLTMPTIYNKVITFFLCVIFRAFSFIIVIISPTHAQFTSLLCTLAYMFRPLRAIIRASQITKDCRLKCVSMYKILEFYKRNG